jgi:phosphoribosylformylglycinamidine synthase
MALELDLPFDWMIEVGFRPGVTDNEGHTATEALQLLLGPLPGREIKVYTSRQYLLSGALSREEVETVAAKLLANELIERFEIMSRDQYREAGRLKPYSPRVAKTRGWWRKSIWTSRTRNCCASAGKASWP